MRLMAGPSSLICGPAIAYRRPVVEVAGHRKVTRCVLISEDDVKFWLIAPIGRTRSCHTAIRVDDCGKAKSFAADDLTSLRVTPIT
jgi:hypothetical protein